jgi:hypothetical protein
MKDLQKYPGSLVIGLTCFQSLDADGMQPTGGRGSVGLCQEATPTYL